MAQARAWHSGGMTTPPLRRRLAPEVRRAQLIDTAITLIAEGGYRGFTLSRVAQEAHITRAGVLHHFASKEELLVEVLRHRDESDLDRHRPTNLEGNSPADVRLAMDRLMHLNHERRELVLLYTTLASESLDENHPAHDYFVERLQESRKWIAGLATGWHPDPDALAVDVLAFMDGLQLNWLRDPTIDFEARWSDFADNAFAPYTAADK
jgi:AcrR family transcriptional regulator